MHRSFLLIILALAFTSPLGWAHPVTLAKSASVSFQTGATPDQALCRGVVLNLDTLVTTLACAKNIQHHQSIGVDVQAVSASGVFYGLVRYQEVIAEDKLTQLFLTASTHISMPVVDNIPEANWMEEVYEHESNRRVMAGKCSDGYCPVPLNPEQSQDGQPVFQNGRLVCLYSRVDNLCIRARGNKPIDIQDQMVKRQSEGGSPFTPPSMPPSQTKPTGNEGVVSLGAQIGIVLGIFAVGLCYCATCILLCSVSQMADDDWGERAAFTIVPDKSILRTQGHVCSYR